MQFRAKAPGRMMQEHQPGVAEERPDPLGQLQRSPMNPVRPEKKHILNPRYGREQVHPFADLVLGKRPVEAGREGDILIDAEVADPGLFPEHPADAPTHPQSLPV